MGNPEPRYRWKGADYEIVRIFEGVSSGFHDYANLYRSTFTVTNFPFATRLEVYCVAKRKHDALLVDVGHPDLCDIRVVDGIPSMLGVPWENTDVFITHFHGDHAGNLPYVLAQKPHAVYSGAEAHMEAVRNRTLKTDVFERGQEFLREVDAESLRGREAEAFLDLTMDDGRSDFIGSDVPHVICHGGEVLHAAGFSFEVVPTPGHTLNHLCLLDRDRKIFFAGDHVLDAPPGMPQFERDDRLIQRYLHSMDLVHDLDLQVLLMSHHEPLFGSQSIDGFLTMIRNRYASLLTRTMGYVKEAGRLTVREASVLAARHYEGGLDRFSPAVQVRRIATMFGSLEYAHDEGYLERSYDDAGHLVYWPSSQGRLMY